jgi:hypothetical protein
MVIELHYFLLEQLFLKQYLDKEGTVVIIGCVWLKYIK